MSRGGEGCGGDAVGFLGCDVVVYLRVEGCASLQLHVGQVRRRLRVAHRRRGEEEETADNTQQRRISGTSSLREPPCPTRGEGEGSRRHENRQRGQPNPTPGTQNKQRPQTAHLRMSEGG